MNKMSLCEQIVIFHFARPNDNQSKLLTETGRYANMTASTRGLSVSSRACSGQFDL